MTISVNLNKPVIRLTDLKPGEYAFIHDYRRPSPGSYRLKELGLISGAIFRVKQTASAFYPLEINLRDYDLLISREDAEEVLVTRIDIREASPQ